MVHCALPVLSAQYSGRRYDKGRFPARQCAREDTRHRMSPVPGCPFLLCLIVAQDVAHSHSRRAQGRGEAGKRGDEQDEGEHNCQRDGRKCERQRQQY